MTFLMEDAERESLQAALSFMDDFEASTSSLSSELRTSHDRELGAEDEELLSYAGELDIIEIESLIDEGQQFALGPDGEVHRMTTHVVSEQPTQYRHVKKARAKTKKEKALALENGMEEEEKKKKKKKKVVTWDPNKARNERKAEIIYLRKQVSDLQTQLDDIEKKKPRICSQSHSSSSSQNKQEIVSIRAAAPRTEEELSSSNIDESSVWKAIAGRQHNMRVKSEHENIRLKIVLENQLRIAKSLEEILNKKTIKKDMERCTDGKLLSHMYPPTADRSDAAAFEELLAGVEQSYAEIDAIFQANGLVENETRSDAKMRCNDSNDIYLEVFEGKVLPFELQTTGVAVWRHFVQAKERKRHRFYFTDTQTHEITDDTLVENFNMILHANRTSAVFKVKQILRRYIEEERVIIVWWAFIDPIELSDEPLSGVRFLEKGYILIKKPTSMVSGDDFSLLQTCYITTPLFTGEWTQDDHPQVGAITDFVLSTTKFNISTTHQMIEDVLLQQAMKTDSSNTSRACSFASV